MINDLYRHQSIKLLKSLKAIKYIRDDMINLIGQSTGADSGVGLWDAPPRHVIKLNSLDKNKYKNMDHKLHSNKAEMGGRPRPLVNLRYWNKIKIVIVKS